MKKFIALLAITSFFMGCTSSTQYGDCIGLDDDEVPGLKYDVNVKNVVIGIVFSAFIIPPVVVVLSELQCPIGTKVILEPLAFNVQR